MQPVRFRVSAIKASQPLLSVGKHKQAWCVDYKYNPLIISEHMEDFDV